MWDNRGMLKHFQSQDNRREYYMVAGLILAALTFTHWQWGWPIGASSAAQPATQTGGSVLSQIPWWHLLEGLPLIAVGILYFLGRRHGKNSGDQMTPSELKEQIKTLTKERGELHSEVARLNEHRTDLLGKLVQGQPPEDTTLQLAESRIADAEKRLSECLEKRGQEVATLAKIWDLKNKAREIRSRWPGSYFERRPLDKESWNTRPFGGWFSRNWPPAYVDHAITWFQLFYKANLACPKCADSTWLKSLNFDDVMDLLDTAERQATGHLAPQAAMPIERPMVDASSYGKAPEGIRDGLYLVNHWPTPALELRIEDTRFGGNFISFKGPSRLAKEDKTCFFSMHVEDKDGTGWMDNLFGVMRDWQKCADDWTFRLPVSIVYRDFHNNWYRSVCELEPDSTGKGSGPIKVTFVGQEALGERHD
jgi:hypothetical protein